MRPAEPIEPGNVPGAPDVQLDGRPQMK